MVVDEHGVSKPKVHDHVFVTAGTRPRRTETRWSCWRGKPGCKRAQTLTRVPSLQEDLFSSAKSNEVVASSEDNAVELMMYRQRCSGSDAVWPCEPESQGPPEPLPDELGPAERGEAPPLGEVGDRGKGRLGLFLR